MNISLLRDRVKESNIKKSAIKDAVGCSYYTLQSKLEGKTEFTITEMNKIGRLLNLSRKDMCNIFFD